MAAPAGFDLTGTVRSLLNIEVNTIIAEGMTAEPMPPLPHAVLDVAGWYANLLCKADVDLRPYFEHPAAAAEKLGVTWAHGHSFSSEMLKFSPDTFERLRWAAKAARDGEAARGQPLSATDRVLLDRIVNSSDTLRDMLKRFGPDVKNQFEGRSRAALAGLPIDRKSYFVAPDDIVTLQKVWDLGTDRVVAQTVVFLNGSVTTRIQEGFNSPEAQALIGIHRQSVDVSIGSWHFLLQAIQEIAGTALATLFGRRP